MALQIFDDNPAVLDLLGLNAVVGPVLKAAFGQIVHVPCDESFAWLTEQLIHD